MTDDPVGRADDLVGRADDLVGRASVPAAPLATHLVPEGTPRQFIDRYASRALPTFLPSPKSARKAVKRGDLRVDGRIVPFDHVISAGQRLDLLPSERTVPPDFDIPLKVAFEDDFLAVVDKPPGLPVSGNLHRTVEHALRANLAPTAVDDALPWPVPAHRLDVRTGGLLLVAKCRRAQVRLGQDFEGRLVHKRYRALLVGRLDGEGVVDAPIEGRPAVTRWAAVAHTRALRGEWVTTADLWPETGRTHQLRKHVAGLGCPVLGDEVYGRPGLILEGKGLFLWAVRVAFAHPISGEPVAVEIPEPAKFEGFRRREAERWARYAPSA